MRVGQGSMWWAGAVMWVGRGHSAQTVRHHYFIQFRVIQNFVMDLPKNVHTHGQTFSYDGVLPKATFVFQRGLKSKIKNE